MIDATQMYDEQSVLAVLLRRPDANRWELDGLEESLFVNPVHRQIARALITLRDRGVRIHWRRVRVQLRGEGFKAATDLVEPLVRAMAPSALLTVSVSRLHKARADRNTRRSA